MVYSRMIRIDERLKDVLEAEADKDDRSVNWLINKILCDRFLGDQSAPETKAATKKKSSPKKEILSEEQETALQALCREIWKSYSDAYYARYQVEPVRNVRVNSQVKKIAQLIGKEAVQIMPFYLSIHDAYLLKASHSMGAFVQNCEAYVTQYRTGEAVTHQTIKEQPQRTIEWGDF